MQLRSKTPKRRVKAKLREDRAEAVGPNDVWAMNFVRNQLATGRKIRVLPMVGTIPCFSPVLDPRLSHRGEAVVANLERVCRRIGDPKTIRVDQGSEFISRDLDLWAYQRGVTLDFSRSGKPTDNAYIEPPTAGYVQNVWTHTGFLVLPTQPKSWRLGVETTMNNGHTAPLVTRFRQR